MKTLITLLALALTGGVFAQEMDMKPPAELKNLAWMVGEWTGTMTMSDPSGSNTKVTTHIKAAMSLEDRYVEAKHTFKGEGMPNWAGLLLATYDATSKTYKAWWFDSMVPGCMEMEGTLNGNKLMMVSKPTEMPGMGAIVMRVTWLKKSDKEFTFTLEMKDGDKWNKFADAEYKKK